MGIEYRLVSQSEKDVIFIAREKMTGVYLGSAIADININGDTHLENLYVEKKEQNNKIGTTLFSLVLVWAVEKKSNRIVTEVVTKDSSQRLNTVSIIKRFGFVSGNKAGHAFVLDLQKDIITCEET